MKTIAYCIECQCMQQHEIKMEVNLPLIETTCMKCGITTEIKTEEPKIRPKTMLIKQLTILDILNQNIKKNEQ